MTTSRSTLTRRRPAVEEMEPRLVPTVGHPMAQNDAASTSRDVAVTVNVLANDYPGPGNVTLRVIRVQQSPNGTATVNADHTISYRPRDGFSGSDVFAYTVANDYGLESAAAVTVTVGVPPANPDFAVTSVNTPVTIGVLDNDFGPVTLVGHNSPHFGTALQNPNGTIRYVPAPNFRGTDSFAYTVRDADGRLHTAAVTVEVKEPEDPFGGGGFGGGGFGGGGFGWGPGGPGASDLRHAFRSGQLRVSLETALDGKPRLLVVVRTADGREVTRGASPMQKKKYRDVRASLKDADGDGFLDTVVMTGVTGGRRVRLRSALGKGRWR